jgi:hypothetical protein
LQAAVAHVHAIDDGISKWPAALDGSRTKRNTPLMCNGAVDLGDFSFTGKLRGKPTLRGSNGATAPIAALELCRTRRPTWRIGLVHLQLLRKSQPALEGLKALDCFVT